MSYKTFICCICGEETTKPKSYAIADKGRACRSHQESQSAREQFVQNEQAKAEARLQALDDRKNQFKSLSNSLLPNFRDPRSYCWCCEKDGIVEHELELRRLVLMEKYTIKECHVPNIFDEQSSYWEELREEFKGKKIIKFFKVDPDYPGWKLKLILPNKPRQVNDRIQLIRSTRLIILCTECSKQHDFKWDWDVPVFNDTTLIAGMLFYDEISPALKAEASGELAEELIVESAKRSHSA